MRNEKMETKEIKLKSLFQVWRTVTKEVALEFAKSKMKDIVTTADDNKKLEIINSRLSGIQFTLEQLNN